ncbi:MAG TPA: hypothetical protein PLL69_09510 [Gemmatimonadales bacterium]|nr:hypothetical protein [Gemmatimonadales bacterium]
MSADVPVGDVRVHAFLPTEHSRGRWAGALSVLFHVLIIGLLIGVGLHGAAELGNPLLDLPQLPGGGGGGGKGGEFVLVTIPPPPPPPPPPAAAEVPLVVPTEIPEPVEEPAQEVPPPPPQPVVNPGDGGSGGGSGGGQGTGTRPGQGSGIGPGSGGGSGGGTGGGGRRGRPPEPRTLIIPPIDNIPRALRGRSVEVTFYIDVTGVVTDIRVSPPISDRGFARKFDEAMRSYRFRPARDSEDRIVAGVFPVTLTFPER